MTKKEVLEKYFDVDFDYSDDFAFDCYREIVLLPKDYDNSHSVDKMGELFFQDVIARCSSAKQLSLYLVSVLHEIGHNETLDEMEDDSQARTFCNLISDFDIEKSMQAYLKLPNEYIATQWAIDFIDGNFELVKKIDEDLQKAIDK